MQEPKKVYIGVGSNLGDRKSYIKNALRKLSEHPQIDVVRQSQIVESPPLGIANQPDYLDTITEVKTTLPAEDLFAFMQQIEKELDRIRNVKWAPRTIDLDLILYGNDIIDMPPKLIVPHPEMHLRTFVLGGMCELNPELLHPVLKVSLIELKHRLNGRDFFLDTERPQLISVAGIIGVGKTTLAEKLTDALQGQIVLEPYAENPYLPALYEGGHEYALASQIYFLTSRTEQLAQDVLEKGKVYISDYVFEKELIYARQFLDKQQFELYHKTNTQFAFKVSAQVLTIYLQDSIQNCLERIHQRNRSFEQNIQPDFLQSLSNAYENLFDDWNISPLIKLSLEQFDCTKSEDIDVLARQAKSYIAV